jgi:UDP-N-acetylmuramoyl-L-alanyl-D-glutamate--2,6-diaminopimelate ligase
VAEDPRQALAYAAALWFGAQPETMVAVTGTNGKTSVASFTRQIWEALGLKRRSISAPPGRGRLETPSGHTTPEPITLHRVLAEARRGASPMRRWRPPPRAGPAAARRGAAGGGGLHQPQQDHLDYHATISRPISRQGRAVRPGLPEDGVAVINIDDAAGRDVAEIACGARAGGDHAWAAIEGAICA